MEKISVLVAHNCRTGARYLIVRTQLDDDCKYDVFTLNSEGEAELVTEEEQNALLDELQSLTGGITVH